MTEVWYLARRSWDPAEWLGWVGADEAERARRYRATDDSGRFLASRALLRAVVGRAVGRDAQSLRFDRSCPRCGHAGHGPPRLVPAAGDGASVYVSTCRTRGAVAVAVGPEAVGLDAEGPDAAVLEVVASGCFTVVEREWVHAAPGGMGAGRALWLWVAKEAVGKLAGLGLAGVERVRVPLDAIGPAVDADGRPCWLKAIELAGTAAAAVATYDPLASRPDVRPFVFT